VSAVAGLDPTRAATVDVAGHRVDFRADGDLSPVEACALFLRDLADIGGTVITRSTLRVLADQLDP